MNCEAMIIFFYTDTHLFLHFNKCFLNAHYYATDSKFQKNN